MAQSLSLRIAAPLLTGATLLIGTAAPLAQHAHADFFWCWDDPIVSVQGHLLEIRTGQPLANLLTMRSTALTVIVPQNVSGSVVLDDVSAFPMKTTISATGPAWKGSGAIPVTIEATVTAGKSYPVQLVALPLLNLSTPIAGPTSTQGQANATITMSVSLGK
jgi:hypothetical protein